MKTEDLIFVFKNLRCSFYNFLTYCTPNYEFIYREKTICRLLDPVNNSGSPGYEKESEKCITQPCEAFRLSQIGMIMMIMNVNTGKILSSFSLHQDLFVAFYFLFFKTQL